jgi:hypothetical protein
MMMVAEQCIAYISWFRKSQYVWRMDSKDQTFMKIKWFKSMGRYHLLFKSNKLSISMMYSCAKLQNENTGENREKLMEE